MDKREREYMAHKTFISYKYSDVVEYKGNNNLRDKIIARLGADAKFYKGENGYSKDVSSYTSEYIKTYLKDMIYDTSVTIVILSPNMNQNQWIEWEIVYSLKSITRADRTSRPNGVVCVVQKQNGWDGYSWLRSFYGNWNSYLLPGIINKNMNNKKSYGDYSLSNNYIDIVTEDDFLRNPSKYIEEAYQKSENIDSYTVRIGG